MRLSVSNFGKTVFVGGLTAFGMAQRDIGSRIWRILSITAGLGHAAARRSGHLLHLLRLGLRSPQAQRSERFHPTPSKTCPRHGSPAGP
jgi:threonine dehydrogenase-like Zn-dependent dehydrogenase